MVCLTVAATEVVNSPVDVKNNRDEKEKQHQRRSHLASFVEVYSSFLMTANFGPNQKTLTM
jgi:hypothetical protein